MPDTETRRATESARNPPRRVREGICIHQEPRKERHPTHTTERRISMYNIEQTAGILGYSIPEVQTLIEEGELNARKVGDTYYIGDDDLLDYANTEPNINGEE